MFDNDSIGFQRFYDVLPNKDHNECYQKLINGSWNFSGWSNADDPTRFWNMPLQHDDFFTSYFLNVICSTTGRKFYTERVYANGQTHGQCGSLHTDHIEGREDVSYTFLYYANPEWYSVWGGGTAFWASRNQHKVEEYIPNSAVIFKGNTLHAGLEPTRHCYGLRITVAYKLIEIK